MRKALYILNAAKLWNILPPELSQIESLCLFKTRLDNFFWKRFLISLQYHDTLTQTTIPSLNSAFNTQFYAGIITHTFIIMPFIFYFSIYAVKTSAWDSVPNNAAIPAGINLSHCLFSIFKLPIGVMRI